MRPGDRLVCTFVNDKETGDMFTDWPLHITIVPWFRTEVELAVLVAELESKLSRIDGFDVVMGSQVIFGRGKSVSLVEKPTPLTEVEEIVRSCLKNHNACIVDETTKRHHTFRPHVTEQRTERLKRGDYFFCDRLYIIEQKGGHKEVSAVVELGYE
jgi:hypothetical protein